MARNLLKRFSTIDSYNNEKCELEKKSVSFIINKIKFGNAIDYTFVDLGLPSGTKWASSNIGACRPEDSGLYFAWGETEGYSGITDEKGFYWGDYKYTSGACTGATDIEFRGGLTKYNNKSTSGTVDNILTLEQIDDAAYQVDNTYSIPTRDDFNELTGNTTLSYENINGVYGMRFISKINGNSIFIPHNKKCINGKKVGHVSSGEKYGCIWLNSLNNYGIMYGTCVEFVSSYQPTINSYVDRSSGLGIRAVKK